MYSVYALYISQNEKPCIKLNVTKSGWRLSSYKCQRMYVMKTRTHTHASLSHTRTPTLAIFILHLHNKNKNCHLHIYIRIHWDIANGSWIIQFLIIIQMIKHTHTERESTVYIAETHGRDKKLEITGQHWSGFMVSSFDFHMPENRSEMMINKKKKKKGWMNETDRMQMDEREKNNNIVTRMQHLFCCAQSARWNKYLYRCFDMRRCEW